MNVAICENEQHFCDVIKEYCEIVLSDMGVSYEIDIYLNGTEFWQTGNIPDIVFMDIEMQGEDGFATAKEVFEREPDILIVFVTARQEKVKQAFRVRAFRFLEKPVLEEEIRETLLAAAHYMSKRGAVLVKDGNAEIKMRHKDILYIESLGCGCAVHGNKTHYLTGNTLKYYSEYLYLPDFFQVSRTHIVSMEHVVKIDERYVYMDSGERIAVSRRLRKKCRTVYKDYLGIK